MASADTEAPDDRLVVLMDEATDVLSQFVVPLYRDESGRPTQVGTGFFVRAGKANFLVSAAHVLELGTSLFYYVEPNVTAALAGDRRLSKWTGDRENDPVDVGVLKLSTSTPPYPGVGKYAVDFSYLRPGLLPRADKIYSIIGFPATRSKVDTTAKQVSSTVYAFRNRSIPDADYAALGCSPSSHVVHSMDLRDGVDSEGRQRTFPKPQGMSGSPILMLLDEQPTVDIRSFPIVAIGTKYRKSRKALIGTDVDIAVAMINEAI
jgi:hypothetical protein